MHRIWTSCLLTIESEYLSASVRVVTETTAPWDLIPNIESGENITWGNWFCTKLSSTRKIGVRYKFSFNILTDLGGLVVSVRAKAWCSYGHAEPGRLTWVMRSSWSELFLYPRPLYHNTTILQNQQTSTMQDSVCCYSAGSLCYMDFVEILWLVEKRCCRKIKIRMHTEKKVVAQYRTSTSTNPHGVVSGGRKRRWQLALALGWE
jgi:hypothetical protein